MNPFPCRLLVHPPRNGAWNMAVDEVLLDDAAHQGIATLRFYQWAPATLTLGYFQQHQDRQQHTASLACPAVRRHSGGGAILHDNELTYSLALPAGATSARDPFALYLAVHATLVKALELLFHLPAGHCFELCQQAIPPQTGEEPFLCFKRRARGDLLLWGGEPSQAGTIDGANKIAGSSQRKRRGAVLQHGSILLSESACAPELPGLAQLLETPIEAARLTAAWLPALAERLRLEIVEPSESEPLKEHAVAEALSRFAQPAWNNRR